MIGSTAMQHIDIELNPDEIYLSAKQVKQRFNVGHATLYELRKDPKFPAPFRMGPRLSRWKLSELEAWAAGTRGDVA